MLHSASAVGDYPLWGNFDQVIEALVDGVTVGFFGVAGAVWPMVAVILLRAYLHRRARVRLFA